MKFSVGFKGEVKIIPVLKDTILEDHKKLMEYLKEKEIFQGKKGQIYSDVV